MYISFSDRRAAKPTAQAPGLAATRVSAVVVTLGIVSLVTDVSTESVSAVLPLYITGVLGLSTVAYGFMDGIYQGISAIVRIAGGWASDRADQPKWVAFFGYGLSALARTGLLFATGFTALVAVISVDRLGKGIRTAPRDALITASSPPEDLGRSFGVHRMLDTVGAAVGPLLAFAILFAIPDGYDTVFVVSLAFALVGVIVLGFLVPNTRPHSKTTPPGTTLVAFRWAQLRDPRLRRLLLTAGLLGMVTIGDGFLYLVLQSRDAFAAVWFPLLYVGTNVVFLLLAIPLGRAADRFGRGAVFVGGHLALLTAYLSAAVPVTGWPTTVLCLIALGVFYASTDGILAALAAQSTPAASRATAIASAQTVVAVTRLIASTGFGLLWFAVGRGNAMLIIVAALAVLIPLAALVLRGGFVRDGTP